MTPYTHGGDVLTARARFGGDVLDCSANLNPLGMPPAVQAAAAAAAVLARPQHLHLVGTDLGAVLFNARLICPLAGAQAAFHVHLRALAQVLASNLGEATIECHPMPFCMLLGLTGLLVLPLVRCGDSDVADHVPIGESARLWISAQIADDDHLVD